MVTIILKQLIDQKGITRYRLSQLTGIGFPAIDRYYKNQVTRYDSYILSKICEALNCEVGDILQYTPDTSEPK